LRQLRVFRPSAPAGEQAMSWLSNGLALLRDERIAPLAVSALPAWLTAVHRFGQAIKHIAVTEEVCPHGDHDINGQVFSFG
jgi:hypothetical protein